MSGLNSKYRTEDQKKAWKLGYCAANDGGWFPKGVLKESLRDAWGEGYSEYLRERRGK